MGIFARSTIDKIIQLLLENRLKDVYMEKETPDGQTILKVTLMPFQGFKYQKDDKVFTSDDYDKHVDLTIIYLELQKQIGEFQLEQDLAFARNSICCALGVDFAAVGSRDVTVYQEIKPINADEKPTGKLLSEEAIIKAAEAILERYPIQPMKIIVKP